MRILVVAVAIVGGAGCATQTAARKAPPDSKPAVAAAPKSLYERLGGQGAVEAVIDDFLGRVAKDDRINAGFAVAHVPKVRQRLVELVCVGTGGPCKYSGRDMVAAHEGQGITTPQFEALVGHLVATLDAFKVPAKEKGELLGILGPMKGSMVEE